jgi:soluble lytic murein transglycosylase
MRSRRIALLAGAVLVVAVVTPLLLPTIDKTYDELTLPLRHEDIIRQQAAEKNLDPALIAGVIYAESKFTDATSPAGAQGLMQITPATAEHIAKLSGAQTFELDDLSNPDINIRYGTYLLADLMERYDGNLHHVLAAYNAGPGNVDEWIAEGNERVSEFPFKETRDYVQRVIDARGAYRREYAAELGL